MVANALATALAFAVVILAIVVPGVLVVRLAGLGRTPLERFGLAVAFGRMTLGLVGLALSGLGGMGLLPWLVTAALAAYLVTGWQRRGVSADAPAEFRAALWPIAAALLLGGAMVFRSGVLDPSGDLVFRGKDATNDPLFYAVVAAQLAARGLPLQNPLVPGLPMVGHEIHFGALAALHSLGVSLAAAFESWVPETTLLVPFAITFRALPILDLTGLGLAAFSLARAFGASLGSAALAGVLVLLGGEALLISRLLAAAAGVADVDLPAWIFFGPALAPVNPIGPAMQLFFVAAFLLARLPAGGAIAGIAAGLLLGASSEIKFFVQATGVPALIGVAALFAPPAVRRPARFAAAGALVIVLPSVAQKLVFASGLQDRLTVGFKACPGCLPRYLLDATFGSHNSGFAIFESFRVGDLLSTYFLTYTVIAVLAFLVISIGARSVAIPQLVRGCKSDVPGLALVSRVILGTLVLGFAGSLTVGAAPHYLNASQFVWPGLFFLSFELALVVGRWFTAGRWLLASAVLALALASPAWTLLRMGVASPVTLRATPDERFLMRALAGSSAAGDLVLEPSWLQHPDLLAPTAWLAGRPAYMSTDSAAAYLPTWDRLYRYGVIRRVFQLSDRTLALRSIADSGARWVYAPAEFPLHFEPSPELEPVASNAAGTLYRYRGAPPSQ